MEFDINTFAELLAQRDRHCYYNNFYTKDKKLICVFNINDSEMYNIASNFSNLIHFNKNKIYFTRECVISYYNESIYDITNTKAFTIDSVYEDVLNGEILDMYNGIGDIENHRLNPINDNFVKDSENIFEAARFLGNHIHFKATEKLLKLCNDIYEKNPYFNKLESNLLLLLHTDHPDIAFNFLEKVKCNNKNVSNKNIKIFKN